MIGDISYLGVSENQYLGSGNGTPYLPLNHDFIPYCNGRPGLFKSPETS